MDARRVARSLRVLAAEHRMADALALKDALTRIGHEVVGHAYTRGGTIVLAERTKPDLAVVNLDLGAPSDGIQAAKEIQQKLNTPVIFLADQADVSARLRALEADFLALVSKPYSFEGLKAVLSEAARRLGQQRRMYRRLRDAQTWHWCEGCSSWPADGDVEESRSVPSPKALCNECWVRNVDGTCAAIGPA